MHKLNIFKFLVDKDKAIEKENSSFGYANAFNNGVRFFDRPQCGDYPDVIPFSWGDDVPFPDSKKQYPGWLPRKDPRTKYGAQTVRETNMWGEKSPGDYMHWPNTESYSIGTNWIREPHIDFMAQKSSQNPCASPGDADFATGAKLTKDWRTMADSQRRYICYYETDRPTERGAAVRREGADYGRQYVQYLPALHDRIIGNIVGVGGNAVGPNRAETFLPAQTPHIHYESIGQPGGTESASYGRPDINNYLIGGPVVKSDDCPTNISGNASAASAGRGFLPLSEGRKLLYTPKQIMNGFTGGPGGDGGASYACGGINSMLNKTTFLTQPPIGGHEGAIAREGVSGSRPKCCVNETGIDLNFLTSARKNKLYGHLVDGINYDAFRATSIIGKS